MSQTVRVIAPAKVNLLLSVGEIMPDGYHHLDVVFHALELHDEVVLTPSEALSVVCDPPLDLLCQSDNLAYRAAEAMARRFNADASFDVALRKHIPHGAGLGGGSSDAAAVIAGLAHLWDIDKHDPHCLAVASSLGADVPFFLHGGAALMTDRGDRLVRRLPALDSIVVLVRPDAPVSTAEAYRAFDADPVEGRDSSAVVDALERGDSVALGAALFNNFEPISSALVPAVGDALAWMKQQPGVLGAAVAGSGSAVFSIVDTHEHASTIESLARERELWAAITSLRSDGAKVMEQEGGQ